MKRFLMIAVVWLGSAGFCLAQDSTGELIGFYQRVMTFKVNTGISTSPDISQSLNGGGFGYSQTISDKWSLYFQMGFFGGAKLADFYNIKPILEFQGMQYYKRGSKIDFYGKAGLGFARYVIQAGGADLGVAYKMAFQYGGGTEIFLKNGLYLLVEGTGLTMGVPADTFVINPPAGWNTSFMLTTGIAVRF